MYPSLAVTVAINYISSCEYVSKSQLETECQKKVNSKLNISTKSIIHNDTKALIIDVKLGWTVKF